MGPRGGWHPHDGYFEPWPSPGARLVLPSGWAVSVGHERDRAIHLGDGFEVWFKWLMSSSIPPETNLRLTWRADSGGRVPATVHAVPGSNGEITFVLRPCPVRSLEPFTPEVRKLTRFEARIYRPALEPFLDLLVSAARSVVVPALDGDDDGLWLWMGDLSVSGAPACHFVTGEALGNGEPFARRGPRPGITQLWGDHLVCESIRLPPPKFHAEDRYFVRGAAGWPRGASLSDAAARSAVEANRPEVDHDP